MRQCLILLLVVSIGSQAIADEVKTPNRKTVIGCFQEQTSGIHLH
jgi:hypothetical protein